MTFKKELSSLINRYSREYKSNTQDFILAEYMNECLLTFERIIAKRDDWYDFKPVNKDTTIQNMQTKDIQAPNIEIDEFLKSGRLYAGS